MILDEDVDAFLEHHGVKGMRWGARSGKQKVKISLAVGGSAVAGAFLSRHLRTPLRAIAVGSSVVVGAKAVTGIMNKHVNKKVHKLKNRTTDAELLRRAQPIQSQ